jgi:peroxiredoxin
MGSIRSTFIVDPMGSIAYIWPSVNPWGHANEVRNKLAELGGQKPLSKPAETLPPPTLM